MGGGCKRSEPTCVVNLQRAKPAQQDSIGVRRRCDGGVTITARVVAAREATDVNWCVGGSNAGRWLWIRLTRSPSSGRIRADAWLSRNAFASARGSFGDLGMAGSGL